MNKHPRSKSSLFLMELIINLLFLCLLLTVCMQFFVSSYMQKKDAARLTFAVSAVSSAAEIFKSIHNVTIDKFAAYYPSSYQSGSTVTIFYDKEFVECALESAAYQMLADIQQTTSDCSASFTFSRLSSAETIYSMNVNFHIPLGPPQEEGGVSDETE